MGDSVIWNFVECFLIGRVMSETRGSCWCVYAQYRQVSCTLLACRTSNPSVTAVVPINQLDTRFVSLAVKRVDQCEQSVIHKGWIESSGNAVITQRKTLKRLPDIGVLQKVSQ